MSTTPAARNKLQFSLTFFDPGHAAEIARWVSSDEQLRWVAPSTSWPLTAAKVAAWNKPGGHAFVLIREDDAQPVGYGELNPMRAEPDHVWLGHVIVRPNQRGRGTGQTLVRTLLERAFDRLFARRASLIVFPGNKAAIECYQRVGFVVRGEEYHRFGPDGPKHKFLRLTIDPTSVTPNPGPSSLGT